MKKIYLTLVLLIFSALTFCQTWVSFTGTSTPQAPDTRLLNSSNSEVLINCQVFGMNSTVKTEGGTIYQRINIPSTINSSTIGISELPVITKMIAIPECTNIVATILNKSEITLSDYFIYPSPDVTEEYVNDEYIRTETFSINQQAYSSNSSTPQNIVKIVETGYLRDQRLAQVVFYPIQFNPVTRTLNVITSCNIEIQFTNPSSNINVPTGLFNNVAHTSLLNYPGDEKTASNTGPSEYSSIAWINLTSYSQLEDLSCDYLIVSANDFWEPNNLQSEIKRLAAYRANTDGFKVGIINVSQILDETTQIPPTANANPYWREQKIRNCIQKIYENNLAPNTYDHHLAFVLLIGDALYTGYPPANTSYGVPSSHDPDVIPFSGWNNNYPSDNYYSLLTKDSNGEYDPFPEIFIGRFPVNNFTELFNMVEKTIKYETEFSGQEFNYKTLFTNSEAAGATDYLTNSLGVYQDLLPEIISEPYSYTIFNEEVIGLNTSELVVNEVNNGTFLFDYYGHSHVDQLDYMKPLTTESLKSRLTNDYKTPFFFAHSCDAGSFDHCEFTQECLAEELTRYSPTKGFVGSLAASCKAILSSNDPTGQWPILQFDAIPYYIFEHASSITGEFLLQCKVMAQSSIELPGYFTPTNFYFNYFGDPALNLMAQGYLITHDISINDDITISTDVHVCNGATLRLSATVNFTKNGRLIIDKGGVLIITGTCTFNGLDAYNAVEVNGLITVENNTERMNICFTAKDNTVFSGLILNNPYINVDFPKLSLSHTAIFGNELESFKVGISGVDRSEFDNSALYFQAGNVEIKNTDFRNGTYANIRNSTLNTSAGVKISNCTFNGNNSEAFINIQDYNSFDIHDNTINFSRCDGISLYNSGFGTQTPHVINNNTINFVGTLYDNNNCIKVYHSQVDITNNIITNASYGISCFNNSNIKIVGNCSATNQSSTQQIYNNRQNQIYATSRDYPYQIKYNHFDNPITDNPLVYFNATLVSLQPFLNITCNHWGVPFNPNTELYPYGKYIYSPVWNYGGCNCSGTSSEQSFLLAENAEINSDYETAESGFKDIIEIDPESEYAVASINELYTISLANNNLPDFQSYLDTIPLNDTTNISARAEYVNNWCNVDLKNYSDAIQWYEDRLVDPTSIEDSVFSIIDMNYIILRNLSEDSLKSFPVSKFPEMIVKNQNEFVKKRSDLIDLLYEKREKQRQLINETNSVYLTVYPNPASNSINVMLCSMFMEKFVGNIKLYNELGKLIADLDEILVVPGENDYTFNLSAIQPGIYYLNLFNGKESISSCKVVILH